MRKSFYNLYKEHVNWNSLSFGINLPYAFIDENLDKLNWYNISDNHIITKKFLEKYQDKLIWLAITSRYSDIIPFLHNFKDKVNWDIISSNWKLDIKFIDKYQDYINWKMLISNNRIKEYVFVKYKNKFNFDNIRNKNLSSKFIKTYLDELNLNFIVNNYKLSGDIITKIIDNFDYDKYVTDSNYRGSIASLGYRQILTEKNQIRLLNCTKASKTINDFISNQIVSESLMERYSDSIHWGIVSRNQKLSMKFIEKHADKLYWDDISRYQNLSEKFLEKYQDKINWATISYSRKLSEKFIEKHADKIDWSWIYSQDLSKEFLKKYKDKFFIKDYKKSHKIYTDEEKYNDMKTYAYKYGLEFDGKYLYAYRNHDVFGRGAWNKTIRYKVGKYYRDWHCDMDSSNHNSYGLGIYPVGNTKVKVSIDDWGLWLKNDGAKCRVWGFTVLETNLYKK